MVDNSSEIWIPVRGYEGRYQVSNYGQVKSLLGKEERILKPGTKPSGHRTVNLSKDGILTTFTVHRIVLEAFIGKRPEKMVCCHKNDIPHDNTHNQNSDRRLFRL